MPLSRNSGIFTVLSMKTSLNGNDKHRIRISIRIPDGRLTPTIYLGAAPLTPLMTKRYGSGTNVPLVILNCAGSLDIGANAPM